MIGPHPGARDHEVGGTSVRDGFARVGAFDEHGAIRDRTLGAGAIPLAGCAVAHRAVFQHRHVVPGGPRVRHHRRPGRRQPHDKHADQSIAPGMRMKSA